MRAKTRGRLKLSVCSEGKRHASASEAIGKRESFLGQRFGDSFLGHCLGGSFLGRSDCFGDRFVADEEESFELTVNLTNLDCKNITKMQQEKSSVVGLAEALKG